VPKKILYYLILSTGIVVCLVGLFNFFSAYGDTHFTGILYQITGILCIIGGVVNLLVASKIKKDIVKKTSGESGKDA